jgi:hypothetical protein
MTTIYGAEGEGLSSIIPLGAGLSSIIPLAAGLGLSSIIPLGAGLSSIIPLPAGLGLSSIMPLGAGLFAGDVAPAGVVQAATPTAAITATDRSNRRPDRFERFMLASLATEAGLGSPSPLEMTGE